MTDLDRLDQNEVVEVIRLIRNTANFKNTVFIVAYDRNYVLNALSKLSGKENKTYLEKIFQLEITLPHFELKMIREKLVELLKRNIDEHYHKDIEELILETSFSRHTFIDNFIENIRDATRFANSFTLVFNQLKGEIIFSDLFNIELIKLKYPIVYQLIYKQKNDFFDTQEDGYQKYKSILKTKEDTNKKTQTLLEEALRMNPTLYVINESQIPNIISALEIIFGSSLPFQRRYRELSIVYPTNFDRYFAFRLFETNLSEVQFSDYRKGNQKDFNSQIKIWIEDGLRGELGNRFMDINDFDSRDDFEKIIQAIFYFSNIPKNPDKINDYNGFEERSLYEKLADYDDRISKKFYNGNKEELRKFILVQFENAISPYWFEASFLYFINTDLNTETFPLNENEREEIVINYFNKYLDSVNSFDKNVWNLLWDCKKKKIDGHNYTKVLLPKAKDLLISFIKNKDTIGFLSAIIEEDMRERSKYSWGQSVYRIFGSNEKFKAFIWGLKEDDCVKEMKLFFEEIEKNKFNYVQYEFKHIPVRKY